MEVLTSTETGLIMLMGLETCQENIGLVNYFQLTLFVFKMATIIQQKMPFKNLLAT